MPRLGRHATQRRRPHLPALLPVDIGALSFPCRVRALVSLLSRAFPLARSFSLRVSFSLARATPRNRTQWIAAGVMVGFLVLLVCSLLTGACCLWRARRRRRNRKARKKEKEERRRQRIESGESAEDDDDEQDGHTHGKKHKHKHHDKHDKKHDKKHDEKHDKKHDKKDGKGKKKGGKADDDEAKAEAADEQWNMMEESFVAGDVQLEGMEEWEELIDDDSGLPYWFNHSTGDTTWDRPAALGGDDAGAAPDVPQMVPQVQGLGFDALPPPPPPPPAAFGLLPPGWEAHEDEQSRAVYYYNPSTGATSWDRPTQ
jgi:hypothetical protein